jgi:hypothetical protein
VSINRTQFHGSGRCLIQACYHWGNQVFEPSEVGFQAEALGTRRAREQVVVEKPRCTGRGDAAELPPALIEYTDFSPRPARE